MKRWQALESPAPQTVDTTPTKIDDCYRSTITRDGATVAGSSQLPVHRHFSPEIYLLLNNSKTLPKYVDSTHQTLFSTIGYAMLNRATIAQRATRAVEIRCRLDVVLVRSNGVKEDD